MAATSAIFKGLYTKLLTAGGLKLEVGQKLWYTDGASDGKTLISDSGGQLVLTDWITGGMVTGATQGSVLFAGVGGVISQDNASLKFDDATNTLTAANLTVTSMFLGHGLKLGQRTVTTNPTIVDTDWTLFCNAFLGPITVALPAAASSAGRVLNIKKMDSSVNTVTIDPNGAEQIDGAATLVINEQFRSIQCQCDGSNWFAI